MMNRKIRASFLIFAILFVFSCSDSDEPFDAIAQLEKDIVTIDNYLTANNLVAEKDNSGVRMIISELGTGLTASVSNNSTVEVEYTGKLLSNGNQFDDGAITLPIKSFIRGWWIALSTLRAGSKATVYIPSGYAYGNTEQGGIPPNSILVFDLYFKKIDLAPVETQRFTTDTTAIETYLTNKGIADSLIIRDPKGVRYTITQMGTGTKPTLYNKVHLKYTYKSLEDDATVVGTFETKPAEFINGRVVDTINGMQAALLNMPEGSKATLYVPSLLAFGASAVSNEGKPMLGAHANVIVDLELIDILE
jgi:FKBP-type peptidyl-prolyl cis-trans isomerase